MDSIEVRPARPGEVSAVGELTVAAYRLGGPLQEDPDGGGYVKEVRDAARRASEAELLVAVDSRGSLLGTVTFVLPGSPWSEIARADEAEFRLLAVAPAVRARGVGALLVRHCLERARERGCARLVLSTAAWTPSAHRLYERLGFVRDPGRDWEPHAGVALLVYVHPVDQARPPASHPA